MPRELTCTARVCATHTSEGPAGAPLQLSGEAVRKAVGIGRGGAGARALLTVGSDGGLKEGKKRTNALNAPTLIILGAKKDGPGQTAQRPLEIVSLRPPGPSRPLSRFSGQVKRRMAQPEQVAKIDFMGLKLPAGVH